MRFNVSKNCLVCWKYFNWWEVIVIKAPEWVCFHIDCVDTFPDDKVYTFPEAWIVHEYNWEQTFTTE